MSDEFYSKDTLRKRILELEKQTKKGWNDYQFLQGSQIKRQDYLDERISELEENIAGIRRHAIELEKKADDNHVDMMSNHKEIHELRKELDAVDKIQDRNWKERGKEIAELKELIDDLFEGGNITFSIAHQNREVLRELIDLQYHVYTMSQQHGDSDKYEKLLAKLDGKTNSEVADWIIEQSCDIKTEKKDPYTELQKEAFDDSDEFPFEDLDSGGEKTVKVDHCLTEQTAKGRSTADSKPPEPNSLYDFEGIGKLNEFNKLYEIEEPREDEIKAMDRQIQAEIGTHIFVKREDLELLLEIIVDEDEKWANIDWKILTKIIWRIKEEYNL